MMINGIGTDIVSKKRFLEKKGIEKKFLTYLEFEQLKNIKNSDERINFISGRWAAKESIIKASDKKIIFSNISILNSSTGKPEVFLNGEKSKNILISISHEEEFAIAFSIIVKV